MTGMPLLRAHSAWKGSPADSQITLSPLTACSKVTTSQRIFLSMQLRWLVPFHLFTCFLYLPGCLISITLWQGMHLFVSLLPYFSMPFPKSTQEQGFGVLIHACNPSLGYLPFMLSVLGTPTYMSENIDLLC